MHFCDDDPASDHQHNPQAPNKHNALCNSRSIWSVISGHSDFAGLNNPPTEILNTKPKFNIVRSSGARYVLVADISGSMNDYVNIVYNVATKCQVIWEFNISISRIASADWTRQLAGGSNTIFPMELRLLSSVLGLQKYFKMNLKEKKIKIVKLYCFKNRSVATLLSDMTVVSDATRQQLMDKVPSTTSGSTCIGCGLQMALKVINFDFERFLKISSNW